MKWQTITSLLEQWQQVKADRENRVHLGDPIGPDGKIHSWAIQMDGREKTLAYCLLKAMPDLESIFVASIVDAPRITEIELGEGKVAISALGDRDGSSILFRPLDQPMPIGQALPDSPVGGQYRPKTGDVLIRCTSRDSALMLIEAAAVVLGSFSLCDEVPE